MLFERSIERGHSGDVKIGLTRKAVIMAKSFYLCIFRCVFGVAAEVIKFPVFFGLYRLDG